MATVSKGPYFGFDESELLTELDRLKAARKTTGSSLSAASVNGASFTYASERRDWSLDEWEWNLRAALWLLDPVKYAKPENPTAIAVR